MLAVKEGEDEDLNRFIEGITKTVRETVPMNKLYKGFKHGNWFEQSGLAFKLKTMMRNAKNWDSLSPAECEALDHIQVNISRILCGDSGLSEHWNNVSDYATITRRTLSGE